MSGKNRKVSYEWRNTLLLHWGTRAYFFFSPNECFCYVFPIRNNCWESLVSITVSVLLSVSIWLYLSAACLMGGLIVLALPFNLYLVFYRSKFQANSFILWQASLFLNTNWNAPSKSRNIFFFLVRSHGSLKKTI